MYYKVENINSEIYKKLKTLREKELQIEENNKKAIKEKIPHKWSNFFGYNGQQHSSRVNEYMGFVFKEDSEISEKIWKRHKEYNDVFVPNKRTKLGKQMYKFLTEELEKSCFIDVFGILNHSYIGKFVYPFVEIVDNKILLMVGEDIEDENVIEITKNELNKTINEN